MYRSKEKETGHHYEFVISDVSWTQAQKEAKTAGGYLARFETKDEYNEFLNVLDSKKLNNVLFFIGARRDDSSKDYYWVDNSNKLLTSDKLNDQSSWAASVWAPDEPSFAWKENVENRLQIMYDENLKKWVWNDVPNKVYSPGENKYGYVIEFDN